MTFVLINQKIANCKKNFTIWQEPTYLKEETINRGVARGGRGARAPPKFCRLVNPIQTRPGGQIRPLTLLPTTPGFKKLSTPLIKKAMIFY